MTKDISKIPGKNVFEACIYDDDFLADIAQIRALKPGSIEELMNGVHIAKLTDKYGIPSWFMKVLQHYIETNEIDWALVNTPVRVIQGEGGGVGLYLSHDIKQGQLKQYIDDHFKEDIKPLLEKLASERRKRHSAPYFPDKHQLAQQLHRDKKNLRLDNNGIARLAQMSTRTVSRATKRDKK